MLEFEIGKNLREVKFYVIFYNLEYLKEVTSETVPLPAA